MTTAATRRILYPTMVTSLTVAVAATSWAAPSRIEAADLHRPAAVSSKEVLVDQSFDVGADDPTMTLRLRLDPALAVDPTAEVVVDARRPVATRTGVDDAVTGVLPRSVDTVRLAVAGMPRSADGDSEIVRVVVPLERGSRTPGALQLARAGVHPLVVQVRQGSEVVHEFVTFIHRLPTSDAAPIVPLPVSMVVATRQTFQIDSEGRVDATAAVRAEWRRLVDVLEASAVPVTVRLEPAIVDALVALIDAEAAADGTDTPTGQLDDAELIARLRAVVADQELLSAPAWPLDVSQAAAAGARDLYLRWVREGEEVLARDLSTTARRAVVVGATAPTREGAALLRDIGGRLLVLPAAQFDLLPGSPGLAGDTTELVRLDVGPGGNIDAAVVDRVLDDHLASPTTTPTLTAIHLTAGLVALRQEIADADDAPDRHGLVIATPEIGLPWVPLVGPFTRRITETVALEPMTLEAMSLRVGRYTLDGDELTLPLPATTTDSLAARLATAGSVGIESAATASMLPANDPRLSRWNRLIDLLASSAVRDDTVETIAGGLRSEFTAVRGGITLPSPFSFTLTGRRTEVPVRLFNSSDSTLTVVVRMRSAKLLFPTGDRTVTLPPGEYTEIRIPIEARSNGLFPVTLEVVTPLGSLPIAQPLALSARVNALSGLGNLLFGAFLLVLASWWIRHVRVQRRRRFLAKHPSAVGDRRDAQLDGTAPMPRVDEEPASPAADPPTTLSSS